MEIHLGVGSRGNDGIHGSTRGVIETVSGKLQISALGGIGNPPHEYMVPHGLGIDFGIAGSGVPEAGEAAACADTDVVVERGINGHPVAAFVGAHTVVYEQVIPHHQILRRETLCAALMGDTGVVDVVEIAVLDQDVFAVIPEFDGVAETDLQLPVPHSAADEAEGTTADYHIVRSACHAVDTAAPEAQIFRYRPVTVGRHPALAPYGAFDMGIHFPGVAVRPEQNLIILFGFRTVLPDPGVVPVPLGAEKRFFPAQGSADPAVVINEIAGFIFQLLMTAPDVGTDFFPESGIAYVHGTAEYGIFSFAVCAVCDGSVRRPCGTVQTIPDKAAPSEKNSVSRLQNQIGICLSCVFRRPSIGIGSAVMRVYVVCHMYTPLWKYGCGCLEK